MSGRNWWVVIVVVVYATSGCMRVGYSSRGIGSTEAGSEAGTEAGYPADIDLFLPDLGVPDRALNDLWPTPADQETADLGPPDVAPVDSGLTCSIGYTADSTGTTCVKALVLFATAPSDPVGGRAGADASCSAALKQFPQLAGATVHAFISVANNDEIQDMPAKHAVPTDRPAAGPTGIRFADDWADLLDGSIIKSLAGAGVGTVPGAYFWYSGSYPGGTLYPKNCAGWTLKLGDSGSSLNARIGGFFFADGRWISWTEKTCGAETPALLCLAFEP